MQHTVTEERGMPDACGLCVCVLDGEGSRVVTSTTTSSTAPAVVLGDSANLVC